MNGEQGSAEEGQLPAAADDATTDLDEERFSRTVTVQSKAWAGWLGAYGVTSAGWLPQLEFLAGTVERIDAMWVALVFLNIPLQLLLIFLSLFLVTRRPPGAKRAAVNISYVVSGLILTHIIISIVTL